MQPRSPPGTNPLEIEQTILDLVARNAIKLPPYPAVVLKLQEILGRENYGLEDLVPVVSTDQVLAADVLRCANSAFFGRGEIVSIQQAVTRIGAQEVSRLALVSRLAGTVRQPGALQSLKRQVWQGSVASAMICQVLSRARSLRQDDAFVAGLLHDFGWVIGISAIEELLAARPETPARPAAFWTAMLERLHLQLGLALAARWKLPELFRDVIWFHHDRVPAENPHAPIVELVAAADAVVALLAAHPRVSEVELGAVAALAPAEREALSAALPDIPTVLSVFEGESAGAEPPSKIAAPATTLPEGFRAMEGTVNQVNPRQRGPYGVLGISSQGWLMRGREPLPENQLAEVQMIVQPRTLRLWARPTHCKPDGPAFLLECKPFALSGPTQKVWTELFQRARSG